MPILSGLATGVKSYGFTARPEEEETDEYFYRTSLLLNGDGTDGAQNNTFLDSSSNGHTITPYGTPIQGTFNPQSVGWSLYVNNTQTSWPANCWSGLSGSTFTAEYWFRPFAQGGIYGGTIFGINKSGRTDSVFLYHGSGGHVGITTAGSSVFTSFGTTDPIPLNQWTHVAITVQGTSGSATGKIYINGVLVKTQLNMNTGIPDLGVGSFTGTRGDGSQYALYGDLSSLRIIKDQVLYTGDFTPPTGPLTADSVGTSGDNVAESITGTVHFLTYRDSTIINLGTTGSSTGNASVLKQIYPIPLDGGYDESTHGGSAFVDGTGLNYLTFPWSAFPTAKENFSIDFWLYYTVAGTSQGIMGYRPAANDNWQIYNGYPNAGIYLLFNDTTLQVGVNRTVAVNQWTHYAWTRSGSTFKAYINGELVDTKTNDLDVTKSSYTTGYIFWHGINASVPGDRSSKDVYMSGLRIRKGVVEDFTNNVPTAPPTSDANTSLLLNFTDAGVKDLTGRLNFITVGDCQVDTAVKKYGTGSIKCDGTGDLLRLNSSVQGTAFGQGDFTVEFWLYFNIAQYAVLFDQRPSPAATQGLYPTIGYDPANGYLAYFTNSGYRIQSNAALSDSTWYHIALSKASGSTRLFVDGTQVGSTYADTNNYISGGIIIGGRADLSQAQLDGFIDDFRITSGVGRYTADFDPPTKALPKIPV